MYATETSSCVVQGRVCFQLRVLPVCVGGAMAVLRSHLLPVPLSSSEWVVKLFRRQDSLSVVIRRDGCVFPSYLLPRCFALIIKQCRGWICTAYTALVYATELGSTINAGNLECEPVFRNQRSDLKARSKVRHSHTS